MPLSPADIEELTARWSGAWLPEIEQHLALPSGLQLSRRARAHVREQAHKALGRGRSGKALNWLALDIATSSGVVMNDPHFTDLLRPSEYEPQLLNSLAKVIEGLDELFKRFDRTADAIQLESIRTYVDVFVATRADEAAALRSIHAARPSVAALLSLVEECFSGDRETLRPMRGRAIPVTSVADISREDVATAVSYLLARYNKTYGITQERFGPLLSPSSADSCVVIGHMLSELRDAEAQVFFLGYRCVRTGAGRFEIQPPTPTTQMALAVGYLRTSAMQGVHVAQADPGPRAASLPEVCAKFVDRFHEQMLVITDERPRRLQLRMPEPAARLVGEELFATDGLYREEGIALSSAAYELCARVGDVENFELRPGLTVSDVLRISRLFRFAAMTRGAKLAELRARDEDDPVYLQSILGSATVQELTRLLEAFGVDRLKAEMYLELFTWRTRDKDAVVDLQYRSLIEIQGRIITPFFVHATSNFFRNSLFVARTRLAKDPAKDLLPALVQAALLERTPHARLDVDYDFQGFEGDFDVIARLDDCLFVFECKNALLPCNGFEQRTVFEAVKGGAEQLDKARAALASAEFRRWLDSKLGWSTEDVGSVHTAIVVSNRLLSGASVGGHPVRHVHELVNVLREGVARVAFGDEDYEFSLWRTGVFSVDELKGYLSDDSDVYRSVWPACTLENDELRFRDAVVRTPRCGVDVNLLFADQRARSRASRDGSYERKGTIE